MSDFESRIKDFLKHGIEKMFDLDKMYFEEIVVKRHVLEDVMDFASVNHPKEFVAFFHGKILKKKLVIDRLVYQQYFSSENSATPIFHFADKSFYGSVHSHPSFSNKPSGADLQFFRKTGIVHAIICRPYAFENIRFFNHNGEDINVVISE